VRDAKAAAEIRGGRAGVRRFAVVTPRFGTDCLRTLGDIGVENAGYFSEAGGERFAPIP
jgi:protoporphyrin/coproporphyrin ferrochelatase